MFGEAESKHFRRFAATTGQDAGATFDLSHSLDEPISQGRSICVMLDFGHELALLEPWIHNYGLASVFIILTLESCGIPLPGESLLIVAAIMSGRGDFPFVGLMLAAWMGAVLGDNIGYLIGRKLGRTLLLRYGRKIGLTPVRIDKVEAVFARYGPEAVGFARFFSVLRQLNGVVAGTVKMEWRRFLIFNALGGAAWVLVWSLVGFSVGRYATDIGVVMHKIGILGAILGSVSLLSIVIFLYRRRVLARQHQETRGKP